MLKIVQEHGKEVLALSKVGNTMYNRLSDQSELKRKISI